MRCLKFMVFFALVSAPDPTLATEEDTVRTWAMTLGDELWRLSEALTKSDQIRIKYKQMNASVKKKDGKQILNSALRSVSTMLTRKINAVKCIHATAEEIAKQFNYSLVDDEQYPFEYCSAKYSRFINSEDDTLLQDDSKAPKFARNNPNYMNVTVHMDSHFYDINVNTDTSCVHVPTNIFYREKDPLNAILWSKGLNEIFIKNYKSDPSLAWQYFGSSHGILRFYPGMPWNNIKADTYDCRVQSWYIEAATCSKDVIVLFDISGSMTGFKNYVARRTLRSLFYTLSNNDYVNVFMYNDNVTRVVSCFEGLVQATRENLNTITNVLEPVKGKKHNISLERSADLTMAYIEAFNALKERRKNCTVNSTQGCNQLVMVITDYVPSNLSEVFDVYNREVVGGKTYTPVRVFTYLIGKEVTNVKEIQEMACSNRGYFVHIHSVEEVQQQVLKYINVIARPMILDGSAPPPTWTHATMDETRSREWNVSRDVVKPDEDKLVTSVAIPAFDYKYNEENSGAMLLGVAGTDVPIDSIAKLAQPHQLGVNGYSFIVSNNGFLLLHPLLITTINGKLQENYNSVDFVEVEQVDDGKGPRELGDKIKKLRSSLVEGSDGKMTHVEVLYHYDQMRRIARVKHDYFFNTLEGTPFSMGISLPRGYGDTELLLKDNPLEAKQGKELTGINVTDYFRSSYRVHPDWVYCKYHYLEDHEAPNVEQGIWRFLVNLSKDKIDITKKQYSEEVEQSFDMQKHCGNGTIQRDTDDYYCNEDLVKQLVFDAKLTTPYFGNWSATEEEWNLAKEYDVNVRFIATASGLTRWHYIFEQDKNEWVQDDGSRVKAYNGSEEAFGDRYYNAIEETWYKAAVLQHMINKESLVVATRLPILDDIIEMRPAVENNDGSITLTASYAIFYKDGQSETPASVVGFEFAYKQFLERFLKLTNSSRDRDELLSCNDSRYDCYVVDSSGYIILSKAQSDVGQFFGVINKYVLKSLTDKKIFDHVEVFNYQALCPLSILHDEPNCGWILDTPFSLAKRFLGWILTEVVLYMTNLYSWSDYTYAASYPMDDDYNDINIQDHTEPPSTPPPPVFQTDNFTAKEEEGPPFSCDHRIHLYILDQSYFLNTSGASPVVHGYRGVCNPSYWAAHITKTSLLLVVVDNDWSPPEDRKKCVEPHDTKPRPTDESITSREPCHKLELGRLERRRLEGCYTYHDQERNITACGLGHMARSDLLLSATMAILASFISTALM